MRALSRPMCPFCLSLVPLVTGRTDPLFEYECEKCHKSWAEIRANGAGAPSAHATDREPQPRRTTP